jgi:hypothetical protein
MRPGALTKSAIAICLLALSVRPAMPQESESSEEVRSMLRAASALIPHIEAIMSARWKFSLDYRTERKRGSLITSPRCWSKRARKQRR